MKLVSRNAAFEIAKKFLAERGINRTLTERHWREAVREANLDAPAGFLAALLLRKALWNNEGSGPDENRPPVGWPVNTFEQLLAKWHLLVPYDFPKDAHPFQAWRMTARYFRPDFSTVAGQQSRNVLVNMDDGRFIVTWLCASVVRSNTPSGASYDVKPLYLAQMPGVYDDGSRIWVYPLTPENHGPNEGLSLAELPDVGDRIIPRPGPDGGIWDIKRVNAEKQEYKFKGWLLRRDTRGEWHLYYDYNLSHNRVKTEVRTAIESKQKA